jgi:hypothetical protein
MTRRIIFVFLLFLAFSSLGAYVYLNSKFQPPPNQLSFAEELIEIPFFWKSTKGKFNDEGPGAIVVPIALQKNSEQYYMHLDLGAPYSVLYQNQMESIAKKSKTIDLIEENGSMIVTDLHFFLDTIPILARNLFVVPSPKNEILDSNTKIKIIGILGADLIEDRRVVINYPEKKITIGSQFPELLVTKAVFSPFVFNGRRVILPATIQNTKHKLLYHTGPGEYDLLTNYKNWDKLVSRDENIKDGRITLWNNQVRASIASVQFPVEVGGIQIPVNTLAYVEGIPFMQRMILRLSGVTAITGNQLFFDKILLLDTTQERFAIVR